MSFYTGTQAELIYSLTGSVTKNTYTTAAAITGVAGTNTVCAIPAGLITNNNPGPLGRSLKLEAFGTIANTAAATFAATLNMNTTPGTNTTNIAVFAATAPTAAVTAPWWVHATFNCVAFSTSSITWQVNGAWRQEATASGAALGASALTGGFQGTLVGDPRVTQYLEIFGTWSASSASNTTTVQQMLLWGLN
jgi:hypothetical protein